MEVKLLFKYILVISKILEIALYYMKKGTMDY